MKLKFNGINCDNKDCGHSDPSIPFEQFSNHVDRGCPKCGDMSWLTMEDYNKCLALLNYVAQSNISADEVSEEGGSMVSVDIRNNTIIDEN